MAYLSHFLSAAALASKVVGGLSVAFTYALTPDLKLTHFAAF
jgi:hypothetical protein